MNRLHVHRQTVSYHIFQENEVAACYMHKVIKSWDLLSPVFMKDHATVVGVRIAAESAA